MLIWRCFLEELESSVKVGGSDKGAVISEEELCKRKIRRLGDWLMERGTKTFTFRDAYIDEEGGGNLFPDSSL